MQHKDDMELYAPPNLPIILKYKNWVRPCKKNLDEILLSLQKTFDISKDFELTRRYRCEIFLLRLNICGSAKAQIHNVESDVLEIMSYVVVRNEKSAELYRRFDKKWSLDPEAEQEQIYLFFERRSEYTHSNYEHMNVFLAFLQGVSENEITSCSFQLVGYLLAADYIRKYGKTFSDVFGDIL